jgi:copper resistance protein B
MKNFLLILSLISFLPKILYASEMNHGDDHAQIFHAFTLEGDIGEDRDGSSKAIDLNGWVGGDINRLWLRGEKKNFGTYEEKSEVQALYSRNISRFFDAQIGLRHDFSTDFTSQSLNYLTIGLEGLAPYLFETNAQIFISEKGNYSARLRQEVDILITQKLIMQPYFEAEFFAQDVERIKVRSGLAEIETGILTRYEISRKFAPYFALRYHAKTFGTAHVKNDNERINDVIMSVGIRIKF